MKSSKIKNNGQTLLFIAFLLFLLLGIVTVAFTCRREMFESKPVLSYYFLPTCGWCKKFDPEWEKFVKMAPETITTQKVDGNISPDVEKYGIKSFPHIQLVKGDKVVVFEGDRTTDNLLKFVTDNSSM
jgi:thioredoxin-like negative regulator of GroEL